MGYYDNNIKTPLYLTTSAKGRKYFKGVLKLDEKTYQIALFVNETIVVLPKQCNLVLTEFKQQKSNEQTQPVDTLDQSLMGIEEEMRKIKQLREPSDFDFEINENLPF